MAPPLVTVAIPAYNCAAFIADTLVRVAEQSFREFEVMVVDDGSTDGTAGAARAALSKLGLSGRARSQPNRKIASARNAAARLGTGELIAFLDADDVWHSEKLARCVAALRADPGASLVCHDEDITRDGRRVRRARYGLPDDRLYERLLFDGNAVSTSATVIRRSAFEDAGGFREDRRFDTAEDYDLWMRLAKRGARFRFLHETLGEYRLRSDSASARAIYHHDNLRALLLDHFASLPPGSRDARRERRRLSVVDRSCAKSLLDQGDARAAGPYARRAFAAAPFYWKNPAVAALWAAKRLAGR